MEKRSLGNTGLNIAPLVFGGNVFGWTANEEMSYRLMDEFTDAGFNMIDTADIYTVRVPGNTGGDSERLIGKWLQRTGKRDKVVIATKVGGVFSEEKRGLKKDYILRSVEDSLQRLQTDYIDLYQLHGGTLEDPIDETIEAFEILKQQGKIRHYGISSIRPNVIREYARRSNIVSVMMQYSLLDRRPEASCLPVLEHHNIGVLARGWTGFLYRGKTYEWSLELERKLMAVTLPQLNAVFRKAIDPAKLSVFIAGDQDKAKAAK